jgi:hypothetical protein
MATLVGLAANHSHRRVTASRPPPSATTLPLSASALQRFTVLYTDEGGPRLTPLDGGPTSTLMPAGPADADRPVQVAGGVAFVSHGQAYFLAAPTPTATHPLGPADHLFAMIWPGLVGVQRGSGPGPVSAQFVPTAAASGGNSPVWQLPAGWQPLAQAGGGLLVRNATGDLRIWSLDGGKLGPLLGQSGTVIDARADEVVWRAYAGCNASAECPLHITNTSTGADRIVAPPAGHAGFVDGGALSPDGRLLAVFVTAPFTSHPRAEMVVIDLGASDITRLANSVVDVGEPVGAAKWTPDGSAVFFCGLSGQMRAYQPGDAAAVTLQVAQSYRFVVW